MQLPGRCPLKEVKHDLSLKLGTARKARSTYKDPTKKSSKISIDAPGYLIISVNQKKMSSHNLITSDNVTSNNMIASDNQIR